MAQQSGCEAWGKDNHAEKRYEYSERALAQPL